MVAILLLAANTSAFAQPANDNFTDRIVLAGTEVSVTGSNVGATRESGEPNDDEVRRTRYEKSVWWSWTAPTNGLVALRTFESDFDTLIEVYTGLMLTNLTLVTNSDLTLVSPEQMSLFFYVSADTTYQIVVGGVNGLRGDSGTIQLQLSFFERPPNDDFANRTDLGTNDVAVEFSNTGATLEAGETQTGISPQGRSMWWSWTAIESGPVTVTVEGSDLVPSDGPIFPWPSLTSAVAVLTGADLGSLQRVTNRIDNTSFAAPLVQLTFDALAGTTYQIDVDGFLTIHEKFRLNVARTEPPAVVVTAPLNRAEFRAGADIPISAQAFDSDGSIARVDFRVEEVLHGTNYFPTSDSIKPYGLTWTNVPPGRYFLTARATDNSGAKADSIPIEFNVRPPNDDFEHRIPFTGSFTTVTGTLVNASWEPGQFQFGSGGDIWWSWTAPSDGTFTITAKSQPGFGPFLNVYRGSVLTNLTLVTNSFFAGTDNSFSTRVVVSAGAGDVLQIDVGDGYIANQCTLDVTQSLPPTVTITSPINSAVFDPGNAILLSADASDEDGSVTRVEFWLDDYQLLGVATNSPFSISVVFTDSNSSHRVRAWATDNTGLTTVSDSIFFTLAPAHSTPPINDNFADRSPITGGDVTAAGTLENATTEPGEPVPGNNSVWWEWTAPDSARYTITAVGNYYYPFVGVYQGDALTNLTLLASDVFTGFDNSYAARVVIDADAGQKYPIAVGTVSGSGSEVTLSIVSNVPPTIVLTSPTNDARFFSGDPVTLSADASDDDGTVVKVEFYVDYSLVATVTNRPFQTAVPFTDGAITHSLRAYATDDGGLRSSSGEIFFTVTFPPPANDDFANRAPLAGSSTEASGDVSWATLEPGEPNPNGQSRSVWWSWTAPESAAFTVQVTSGPGELPDIAVFTGAELQSLTLLTNAAYVGHDPGDSAQVTFLADAGTTYQIQAESWSLFHFVLAQTMPPSATIISPTTNTTLFEHDPVAITADVLDDNGVARVDFYSDYGLLGSATNAPFSLTVTNGLDDGLHRIWVRAIDNLGFESTPSEVWLTVRKRPPVNDDFANRIVLTGTLISDTASIRGATRELAETNFPVEWPGGSVWWSWTTPLSGTAILTAAPYSFCRMTVFSGNDLPGLNVVISKTTDTPSSVLQLAFDVQSGRTYQISMDCSDYSFAPFAWSLFLDARYFENPGWPADGGRGGRFFTTWDESWIVEASDDFVNWRAISTNVPVNRVFQFQDESNADSGFRFYRAKTGP